MRKIVVWRENRRIIADQLNSLSSVRLESWLARQKRFRLGDQMIRDFRQDRVGARGLRSRLRIAGSSRIVTSQSIGVTLPSLLVSRMTNVSSPSE